MKRRERTITITRSRAGHVATILDEQLRPIIVIDHLVHEYGDELVVWLHCHVPGPRTGMISEPVTAKHALDMAHKILAPIAFAKPEVIEAKANAKRQRQEAENDSTEGELLDIRQFLRECEADVLGVSENRRQPVQLFLTVNP